MFEITTFVLYAVSPQPCDSHWQELDYWFLRQPSGALERIARATPLIMILFLEHTIGCAKKA